MRLEGAQPATWVRWRVLSLLVLAGFVGYILRTNVSVAGVPMMEDLGLTREQLGMVLAAFAWGYAIFQFPGGILGDRIGLRRATAWIAVGWGVVTLSIGLIPGNASPMVVLATLIALRFLMGVVQAPLYPLSGPLISNWFPVYGWAFPNALANAGLTMGSAATGPLVAWLLLHVSWRQSFLVTAPLGFLMGALWWWYVRDTPSEHESVNEEESAFIDRGRTPASSSEAAFEKGSWRVALRNRQVRLLTASYFCSNYVFYFFFNWLFVYLVEERGLEALQGGFYAAAPWMTGALGATIGGFTSDSLSRRIGMRWGCGAPAIVSLVLSGLFLGAAALATTPVLAVVLLSFCLGFQQFAEGPYWAATISVAGRRCAAACGVLNTGGNLVGGVVALVVPFTVSSLGWPTALVTASVVIFAGAGLWFFIRADRSQMGDAAAA